MATTINAYKVSLSLDAGQYISASSLSRQETAMLRRDITAARTPAENYSIALNRLNKALNEGAIKQGTYNRLLDSAKSKLHGASDAAKGFGNSIASAVAGFVGASAIKSLIGDSVNLAAEAESASIAFEVLTGSVDESAKMVEGLRQLAAASPLNIRDTQQAAKTMLAFGLSTQEVLPSLRMLGDITGGNSERFKNLTLGFSQMVSAGRLMGGELRQMVEAGFNPLQEISRQTGESMLELKKRMEDGAISSREVAAAFKSATEEGGMFFGMIERASKTTEGKFAKLADEIYGVKKAIGETIIASEQFGGGFDWVMKNMGLLRQGMEAVAGGGAANIKGDTATALEQIRQQQFFADRQVRRKREGKSFAGQLDDTTLKNMMGPAMDLSGGIESAISSTVDSVGSMASSVLSGLSTFQSAAEMITMSGVANTQELIKASKDDPAIASLEVGTQEAYRYLTQATRDAQKAASEEAAKKAQLEANAKAQRDKMNEYLDKINQALEKNGFKRLR